MRVMGEKIRVTAGMGITRSILRSTLSLKSHWKAIQRKQAQWKCSITRQDDRFIELKNRAKIANEADADLFVSIHCDAFTSPKAFGAGTFVLGLHRNKDNFGIAQKENSVIFLEDDYETTYDGFDPNNPESVISLVFDARGLFGAKYRSR